MKPRKDSADKGAGSGCMARLVRCSSLLRWWGLNRCVSTARRDHGTHWSRLRSDIIVFAEEFLPCFLGINELVLECRYLSLKLRYFASVLRFRLALRRHALRYKIRVTVLHASYLLGVFCLEFRYGLRIIKNVLRSNGGTHNRKNRPDDRSGCRPAVDLDHAECPKCSDGRKAKEDDDGGIDEGELCGSHIISSTNVKRMHPYQRERKGNTPEGNEL